MDDTTRGVGPDRDVEGRGETSERNFVDTTAPVDLSTVPGTPPPPTPAHPRTARPTTRTAATGASSDVDPETDRRTREIQAEIRQTRGQLSETIDAIQERLKPANVVATTAERVKTATTDKVRHMAEGANETAQELIRETRHRAYDIVEGARQNPIPALMIGAGVAWLLMDRSRQRETWRPQGRWSGRSAARQLGYEPAEHYDAYPDADEETYGDLDYRMRGARDATTGTTQAVTARARETAEEARLAARRGARRAQNQLQRLMRDNPLLVGAAAVVVGAAVGAALPETERENEWMGEARDSVVDRAQSVARHAASTVQEVAKDAAGEVAERVVSGENRGA